MLMHNCKLSRRSNVSQANIQSNAQQAYTPAESQILPIQLQVQLQQQAYTQEQSNAPRANIQSNASRANKQPNASRANIQSTAQHANVQLNDQQAYSIQVYTPAEQQNAQNPNSLAATIQNQELISSGDFESNDGVLEPTNRKSKIIEIVVRAIAIAFLIDAGAFIPNKKK